MKHDKDNVIPLNPVYIPGSKPSAINQIQESDASVVLTVKDGHWVLTVSGTIDVYSVMGRLKFMSDVLSDHVKRSC